MGIPKEYRRDYAIGFGIGLIQGGLTVAVVLIVASGIKKIQASRKTK